MYGLNVNCGLAETDVVRQVAEDVLQIDDKSIRVPIEKLLEISTDIDTAITAVVAEVAPGAEYETDKIDNESLQVNVNPSGEKMRNNYRESFFQNEDIKYVIFVFNTDNANAKQNQMNALSQLDFGSVGHSSGTSNMFLYIIIILIIAILAGILFFVLKK